MIMFNDIASLDGSESWDEMRLRFGRALGLTDPMPSAALRRALSDTDFAHRLLVSRNSAKFLGRLLDDAYNQHYEVGLNQPAPAAAEPVRRSNAELAKSAAAALVRWGKSGFSQVSADVYQQRTAACQACPHLIEPPGQLVYKMTLKRGEDMRVCDQCGCVAARKARLPQERCPGAHPTEPGLSRWSEPVPQAVDLHG